MIADVGFNRYLNGLDHHSNHIPSLLLWLQSARHQSKRASVGGALSALVLLGLISAVLTPSLDLRLHNIYPRPLEYRDVHQQLLQHTFHRRPVSWVQILEGNQNHSIEGNSHSRLDRYRQRQPGAQDSAGDWPAKAEYFVVLVTDVVMSRWAMGNESLYNVFNETISCRSCCSRPSRFTCSPLEQSSGPSRVGYRP